MPGTIVAFDETTLRATVQPGLRREVQAESCNVLTGKVLTGTALTGKVLTAPQLSDVPVIRPTAEHAVRVGDPCLLIFTDFCLDGWLESRQPVIPPLPRTHDLADAIAIVGVMG